MKTVKLKVGKTEHRLRYDINAIADIEESLGVGLVELFKEENIGFRTIRALLWAGLKWDKELTITDAGDIIQEYLVNKDGTLEQLVNKIVEALQESGAVEMGNVTAGAEE